MKIVFFGTPEFSVPFLNALAADPQIALLAVVTQPDKPVGRKQMMTAPEVKVRAQELGIPVWQFASLKRQEVVEALRPLHADVFVVINYGKMIPADLLKVPKLGCVNVHPSLLPKYRGPSPIRAPIEHGDTETGISVMLLDEGMDTGPILAQKTVPVFPDDTTPTLTDRLAQIGAPFFLEVLKLYGSGAITPLAQDHTKSTITRMLDREDGKIDWKESPEMIERKIRAYTPWPGTYTEINHHGVPLRVKILKARLVDGELEFLEVQPEGRQVMSYEEFVRGYGPLLPE